MLINKYIILLITSISFLSTLNAQKKIGDYPLVDKVPFSNNCDKNSSENYSECLQSNLREQILNILGSSFKSNSEIHVQFIVNDLGVPFNIQVKGFPQDKDNEQKIIDAVKKLNLTSGKYNNENIYVKCYTRVWPKEI